MRKVSANLIRLSFYRLLRPKYSILGQLQGTNIFLDKSAFVDCVEIDRVKMIRYTSAICYLNKTLLRSCIKQAFPVIFNCTQNYGSFGARRRRSGCTTLETCTIAIKSTMSHCCVCCLSGSKRQQKAKSCEPSALNDNTAVGEKDCSGRQEENQRIDYLIIDCSAISYCDQSGAAALVELIDELNERTNALGRVQVYLVSCSCSLIRMIETCLHRPDLLATNVFPSILDALGHINHGKAIQSSS